MSPKPMAFPSERPLTAALRAKSLLSQPLQQSFAGQRPQAKSGARRGKVIMLTDLKAVQNQPVSQGGFEMFWGLHSAGKNMNGAI